MIEYLFKNIFWNPSILKYGLLLGVSFLTCLVSYLILQIIHKAKKLTFDEYIPVEQTAVSLLIALWAFGLFCLPFALIIWGSFYFIYSRSEKNRMIKYVLANPSKQYNHIIMEKRFSLISHKTLLREIFKEKNAVKDILNKEQKSIPLPKRNLPLRIYLSGSIVYFILGLIEQNTISSSDFIWLVLFDNLMAFFGLFYAVYLLLYLIMVKHWLGDYHHYPRVFHVVAFICALIGFVLITAITFNK